MGYGKSKIFRVGQQARDPGETDPHLNKKGIKEFEATLLKPTQYSICLQIICISLTCRIHLPPSRPPKSISHYTIRLGLRPRIS